ncbi:F-box/WD repeat-containing protein [Aspergillus clavatus NRRL 1]|uniref:F-box domain protein n=1 Tax=Aspergillus clavatus (strain ATCC 1007 / CBS 513.65 / DSM 816 / NCTC 3887 / NRRL 1 / QM 1276 / 107) TaxID=344612 RepID=A1CRN7_ASPCL|nr:F-box domain protein [Aspergillus clavatus NRRL 1]EAW08308.1 F-box domain protein [Aspergillus clavatus NRRL 1]
MEKSVQIPKMLLSDLPSDIIYVIAKYLPSLKSLVALAQTCHRLHAIIAAENWRILHAHLKTRFPFVDTPPFWKDTTQALTARARALERHGLLCRHVFPRRDAIKIGLHAGTRQDNPTHGYRPAIDSYEVWNGSSWSDRKEVLVWGAADELLLRIRQSGSHPGEKWVVFNDVKKISSYHDICGVHLLKPEIHSQQSSEDEHMIFGRLNGDLFHLAISPDKASRKYHQQFLTEGHGLERTELSEGTEPILAAHLNNGSIALYQTTKEEAEVQPFAYCEIAGDGTARNKCSKFLSSDCIAFGTGSLESSLTVATISTERVSLEREIEVTSLDLEERIGLSQKANVSAIAPLNAHFTMESPGQVFLAAWGDRCVRLHDRRSHQPFEFTYQDTVDTNPIYCVHPFGQDRFIAGAGGDAVVKIYDLRMESAFSYLNAKLPYPSNHNSHHSTNGPIPHTNGFRNTVTYPCKDFTIFLSPTPTGRGNSTAARSRVRQYRGPVYTMSSPSPISSTVYTGIVDGVMRLDFASSDDLTGSCQDWYRDYLGLGADLVRPASQADRVLELSGYERLDSTSASRLRSQMPFGRIGPDDIENEKQTGWDRRWQRLGPSAPWRRTDG